jgi:hypothetical protein
LYSLDTEIHSILARIQRAALIAVAVVTRQIINAAPSVAAESFVGFVDEADRIKSKPLPELP